MGVIYTWEWMRWPRERGLSEKKETGRRYSVRKNTEKGRSTEVCRPVSAPVRMKAGARSSGREMAEDVI